MENKYYVYIHKRKDTNKVFYVGISLQNKYFRVKIKSGRNSLWKRIANKYGYYGEVVFSGLSKADAIKIEISLIKSFGRIDLKTGCLANLTDGGDGSYNCPKSEETKLKMKFSKIGKKHTNETKNQMSISRTGKVKSDETKQKIKTSMIGKNSKKVVDISSGKVYNSVSEAALFLNIPHPTLSRYLKGILKNKTPMQYL